MVKRIPMDGGDEGWPNPDEVIKKRDAVGAKIMNHWREFGVAFKGRNASEMSRAVSAMKPLSAEFALHSEYLKPGSIPGRPTPGTRLSLTAVEKSTPRRLGGGGGGGGGSNKLTEKKK